MTYNAALGAFRVNIVDAQTARVDTSEAAKLIGVHPMTLFDWRKRGRGPAYVRVGRKVVYLIADIEAWMRTNRTTPFAGSRAISGGA